MNLDQDEMGTLHKAKEAVAYNFVFSHHLKKKTNREGAPRGRGGRYALCISDPTILVGEIIL